MNEKVLEWIEKGNKDLEASKLLLSKIPEYSAYHAQQAVEKFLKAFLVKNKIDFPKTHNIYFLLNICIQIDKDFENLRGIEKLTKYAYIRYPGKIEVSEEEVIEAINIAEKVKDFILRKLKINEEK